ncbi:hypothetical protein HMI55_005503 [Coelomomyces lativittatus]|nr:hypothetical protein HMI55_005503 [Coelomomyces lativittatus]
MSSSSSSSSALSSSSTVPSSLPSVTPVPFTPNIVSFKPYRFPYLHFQYASSSSGEPPHHEVVCVNGHDTYSVYNLTKPGSSVMTGDRDINFTFFQDMEDRVGRRVDVPEIMNWEPFLKNNKDYKHLKHKKRILSNMSFPARYVSLSESEWRDHLITAVLINLHSPHARARLPPGVETLDFLSLSGTTSL